MRGNISRGVCVLAVALIAQVLALGHFSATHRAVAAPSGQLFSGPGKSAGNLMIEVKKAGRAVERSVPPIAPSYSYYDYPYYYSRGHYPTHIRPGFIYFGIPYLGHTYSQYSQQGVRCTTRHRRCVAGWSHRSHHRAKRR